MHSIPKDIDIEKAILSISPSKRRDRKYIHNRWKTVLSLISVYGISAANVWSILNLKKSIWVSNPSLVFRIGNQQVFTTIKIEGYIAPLFDTEYNPSHLIVFQNEKGTYLKYPLDGSLNWIDKFNLLDPNLEIPDINNPQRKVDSHKPTSNRRWADIRTKQFINDSQLKVKLSQMKNRASFRGFELNLAPWQIHGKFKLDSLQNIYLANSILPIKREELTNQIERLKNEISKLDTFIWKLSS